MAYIPRLRTLEQPKTPFSHTLSRNSLLSPLTRASVILCSHRSILYRPHRHTFLPSPPLSLTHTYTHIHTHTPRHSLFLLLRTLTHSPFTHSHSALTINDTPPPIPHSHFHSHTINQQIPYHKDAAATSSCSSTKVMARSILLENAVHHGATRRTRGSPTLVLPYVNWNSPVSSPSLTFSLTHTHTHFSKGCNSATRH
jgi:hypothetical protein